MKDFSRRLIEWQEQHGRHGLPWQQTRDPYAVWLSEIMLQQTTVATVGDYYRRFVERWPTVEALAAAGQRMHSGWNILILDEINTAVALGLIGIQDVLALIKKKPPRLHMILTGRDAHPDLIAIADMVTEMRSIKHPYDEGRPARKGIDF